VIAARSAERDREGAAAEAAAFAADALERAARDGGARVVVVAAPAPLAAVEDVLAACAEDTWRMWAPPQGPQLAGMGEVLAVDAQGEARIAGLRARGHDALAGLRSIAHPAAGSPAPRLVGGLAFRPGLAGPEWAALGDASFAMPKLGYGRDGDLAWATVAAPIEEAADPEARAHAAQQLGDLIAAIAALPGPRDLRGEPARARVARDGDREHWRRRVEAIRERIRRGEVDKIVAARRSVVDLETSVDPFLVLGWLAARYPRCYRFGVARAGAAFVGASPEKLIERRGDRVTTEALAGSIAAGEPGVADERAQAELLASAKDRGEQAIVVREIERALAPLCHDLHIPDAPRVRALHHVLHLETPIRGRLRAPAHVLDLVAALHPTPAVGGAPSERALEVIGGEPAPRGWYAGPVGWFDAEGDGELAVAIRSGLLVGRRAYLYAGAGIVADSCADAEYDEIDLKQRALLDVLGARA
jgi:isochorismate synthase